MHHPPTPEQQKAETEGLIGVGIIILVLFMGSFVLGGSLGLIDNGERPGIFARIVMFGFGGGMFAMAGFVAWRITAEVTSLPPGDFLGIGYRLATRGLERTELRSVGSALVLAPLVYAYLTPHARAAWWRPDAETLIALIPLEFLVIHGFPFLVVIALFVGRSTGWPRWAGVAALVLLFAMYAALAWQEAGGFLGLLALLWLVAPNIMAFLRQEDAWHLRVAAAARWLLRLVVFFGLAVLLEANSLRGEVNLRLGAAYFAAIMVMELFRIFELPLDIAAHWSTIPTHRRRALLPPST